jgi:diadenosine tetraphosphate (Ap4A) HIT family hydrolase
MKKCELCEQPGGAALWCDAACRVVLVEERGYPGFCRVIWNAHVSEMTDLAAEERFHLMRVVFAVEAALREIMNPHKINLASFGNMTPHVHWHVIARFTSDPHFPEPVWGMQQRAAQAAAPANLEAELAAALIARLNDSVART